MSEVVPPVPMDWGKKRGNRKCGGQKSGGLEGLILAHYSPSLRPLLLNPPLPFPIQGSGEEVGRQGLMSPTNLLPVAIGSVVLMDGPA